MVESGLDAAVAEVRKAARELVGATATLTKHLLSKADQAAKDPAASVHKAAERLSEELNKISKELDEILKGH